MHWQGLMGEVEITKRVSGTDPTTENRRERRGSDDGIQ